MGERLAQEVEHQIEAAGKNYKVCMIGHSMGGLIIRAALPRLKKFKDRFHSLITFSSPHLGYSYSSSKIVDTGLWLTSH